MSGNTVGAPAITRRIVELACRAPSVHNTQPWAWRLESERIELHADWSRQLVVSDPQGRNLLISCGAALHHAVVAARALGLEPTVTRFEPRRPRHLATITLSPREPTPEDAAALRALEARRTDRQRFTDWPIPDERLAKVADSITRHGVHGLALTDVGDRFRVELLVSAALTAQAADPRLAAEQRDWVDRGDRDGVSSGGLPDDSSSASNERTRFTRGELRPGAVDGRPDVRIGSDGLIVLGTDTDDRGAWLRAGEALGQLWLHATEDALSVVPLSQVIEVERTRHALRSEVLRGVAFPQLLVRMGWQWIGDSQHRRSPRRPVDDVLLP